MAKKTSTDKAVASDNGNAAWMPCAPRRDHRIAPHAMSGDSAILALLGGEAFCMAVSTYNLTAFGNHLQFSLSQPANRIKHVRIHWQWWNHRYGIRWYYVHGAVLRHPDRMSENIAADQLCDEFTRVTGLHISL